ncbi:NAD(P)-binding protein [Mycena sanguinolenta]|uniref:NAD(P)-binding protein n=1 Tax=Mycena sanguinolenta TaxID=230812 RepID=A0A8H6YYL8_9AGAR|nr:NAD(P)-binding protein [Mycena sanguinolenta]
MNCFSSLLKFVRPGGARSASSKSGSKGLVLISGGTGFVGTEIVRQFAQAGFTVRATARSADKIAAWKQAHPEASDVEWIVVPDGSATGAYDTAIKGVKYVVHSAAPFHHSFTVQENESAMLKPTINMAKAITAAAIAEPSVTHMCITSTFAAVVNPKDMPNIGHTYTGKEWNSATYEMAKSMPNPNFVYCAAKVVAEKSVWENPERKFRVTSICPAMIYGPPRQNIKSMANLNTSSKAIWNLINGKSTDPVPKSGIVSGTDVRDVAAVHVRAIETADSAREDRRILAIAFDRFNSQHVASLVKSFANSPDKLARIKNGGNQGDPNYPHYDVDTREAEALLGRPWIGPDQCIKETAERLWEIEASTS